MKFFSKLVCPLGKIPNVNIYIFDKAVIKNYSGEWFLIENEFYSTLETFDISLGFEDGVIIKTKRNQSIDYLHEMEWIELFDVESKLFYHYNPSIDSQYWPEFKGLTEEAALYIKMKHVDDVIFKDYM